MTPILTNNMKQILLFALMISATNACGQSFDFEKQSTFKFYCNDTLTVESVIMYNMTKESVFRRSMSFIDKTSDGIYFVIQYNWYILYIPEQCIYFKVECHQGTHYSVGNHFIYLLTEIRKNRMY